MAARVMIPLLSTFVSGYDQRRGGIHEVRRAILALAASVFIAIAFGQDTKPQGKTDETNEIITGDFPRKTITVAIGSYGTVSIKDAHFIKLIGDVYVPELSFTVENNTSHTWAALVVLFDIGGLCSGEPHQWSFPVEMRVIAGNQNSLDAFRSLHIGSQSGKVSGCTAEIIRVTFLRATSFGFVEGSNVEAPPIQVQGAQGDRVDFTERLRAIKTKRETEEAANIALNERVRRSEREQARQLAETCSRIYGATSDKKMGDLTVKEAQQVSQCQKLGLYH